MGRMSVESSQYLMMIVFVVHMTSTTVPNSNLEFRHHDDDVLKEASARSSEHGIMTRTVVSVLMPGHSLSHDLELSSRVRAIRRDYVDMKLPALPPHTLLLQPA